MDFEKKQLDLYTKIRAKGHYNINYSSDVLSLIRKDGYLTYLHENLVSQLQNLTLSTLFYDKISVVMPTSLTAARSLMSKFLSEFKNDNIRLFLTEFKEDGFNRKYFRYMLKIHWINEDVSIRVYFLATNKKRTNNLKIDFNLTKSREQALEVFKFAHDNLPPTKVARCFYKSRITRLERYFTLKNIPVWSTLTSRNTTIRSKPKYFAGSTDNGIASSFYISKDNSKEIVIYDKFASETRDEYEDELTELEENTVEHDRDKTLKIKREIKVETKIEVRNRKNKMNKSSRSKNLFFSAPSTFPYFLNTLKFYSPFIFNELSDDECLYVIKNGFYQFVEQKKDYNDCDKIKTIRIHEFELEPSYRKKIEMDLQHMFSAFLADLSTMTKLCLFSSGKPFAKRRELKNKNKFIKYNGFTLLE